ncbi:senescence-associated protein [Plasmodium falciparum IGH-CR14]|uniref:Senescence-associated protein n=2 Tax=Plasmodium falciparum TaxID=5833 RepID=A0A0L0CTP1_PLAFA|nr:senescence-associated protein [Plasmodium falciparum RAJ116]KNG76706.1 senescence-associated protein [Plasmodium falciparum IGH-CR14]
MIGRAVIENTKSHVANIAKQPQTSYPCGNFSDTFICTVVNNFTSFCKYKGSIGHVFTFSILSENRNQTSFSPFSLQEISVLLELIFGHLRYFLTDVPP